MVRGGREYAADAGRTWNSRWITRYLVTLLHQWLLPNNTSAYFFMNTFYSPPEKLLCLTVWFPSGFSRGKKKRMDHMHADCCFIRTIVICMQGFCVCVFVCTFGSSHPSFNLFSLSYWVAGVRSCKKCKNVTKKEIFPLLLPKKS